MSSPQNDQDRPLQDVKNLNDLDDSTKTSPNAPADLPASDLPSELMIIIFHLACTTTRNGLPGVDFKVRRSTLGVCQRWREIALSAPSLWNHVDVAYQRVEGKPRFFPSVEYLKDELERAPKQGLSLQVDCAAPIKRNRTVFEGDIVSVLPQCEAVYISDDHWECARRLLGGKTPVDLPHLRTLIVQSKTHRLHIDLSLAPNITQLYLHRTGLSHSLPNPHKLIRLNLNKTTFFGATVALLRACTNLQQLGLQVNRWERPDSPIPLPTLQELAISSNSQGPDVGEYNWIHAPNVRHLQLRCYQLAPPSYDQFPLLETLSIKGPRNNAGERLDIALANVPSVTELVILLDLPPYKVISTLAAKDDNGVFQVLPALQRLITPFPDSLRTETILEVRNRSFGVGVGFGEGPDVRFVMQFYGTVRVPRASTSSVLLREHPWSLKEIEGYKDPFDPVNWGTMDSGDVQQ